MPITVQLEDLAPRAWKNKPVTSGTELFERTDNKEFNRSKQIIQSSISKDLLASKTVSGSNNGLVSTFHRAWSGHHHITLRPEDIWFAILSQLSFYINAHAEELRSFFVAHEGQKELETIDYGTIDTVDFGAIAQKMTLLIEKNILDPELRPWIMPNFSTTTSSDLVVASILMMGSLQAYFSYKFSICCGIPSVTLLGVKADWEMLVNKLEKIPQLGNEPALFTAMLKPVLERFVRSFESPKDPSIIDFWNRAVHRSGGSGTPYLSGWVTAFCLWDQEGKSLYGNPETPVTWQAFSGRNAGCELDGMLFHRVDADEIPSGFATVPILVDDNGTLYNTKMLAGSVGILSHSSGQTLDEPVEYGRNKRAGEGTGPPGLDSLQPLTGWWMYEVEGGDAARERAALIEKKKSELQGIPTDNLKYPSENWNRYMTLHREVEELESF